MSSSAQLFERAATLHREGRLDAAGALYHEVLASDPNHVEALYFAGILAMRSGDRDTGVALFERALRANSAHSAARTSLARALYELGNAHLLSQNPEAALVRYERLLVLEPGHAAAWSNRGNALRALDRMEAALASFNRAAQLDAHLAEAHYGRGVALRALHRQQEALPSLERALALKPGFVDALANRVGTLDELGRRAEAGPVLEQLLAHAPDYDCALGRLMLHRLERADWRDHAQLAARIEAGLSAGSRLTDSFAALAVCMSAAAQLRAAELHAAAIAPGSMTQASLTPPLAPRRARKPGKIRLAYVSADFREHAASFLMAGVFEHHDRERFKTFAISLIPREPSAIGARVAAAFDHFIDVTGRPDAQIAAVMQELDIDIAVDLMGYTARAQPGIFAHRAAPVQVSYLGFPGTLGSAAIDYLVADSFLVPPELAHHYSEGVVYLPECFQANDARCVIGPTPTRASVGLPDSGPVLCCFNSTFKLNPPVFAAWMRILCDVPDSVLWLVGESAGVQENLRREAAARGVDPGRLVFSEKCSYEAHLGRLALADLFLDTTPYNAGATASDALRVGVPVLTWAGEPLAARMAGSLLRTVGLDELVTWNAADYVRKAVELSSRPELLAGLRAKLAVSVRDSPLFDTARFTRHLEAAYVGMHERAVRGERPQSFAVPL